MYVDDRINTTVYKNFTKRKVVDIMTSFQIASSIVSEILDNYHERLTDDQMVQKNPQKILNKLENISLENFSTQKYSQIDQDIILETLSNKTNSFKHLDLT